MGLYNVLFGTNSYAPILKWVLKLDFPNGYPSGRFRDIYLNKDGTRITLYTRNGGGNRDCWGLDGCNPAKEGHDPQCMISIIKRLREHPNYLKDYDDDFDCTYAYFEFSIPDKYIETTKSLATGEEPKNVSEKFSEIVQEIKATPKEQLEKDERFKPIMEILKHITNEVEKKS